MQDVSRTTPHSSRSLGNALAWTSSTTFVAQIVSWVFTILTARLLTASDFGLIALAETLLPYLTIITSYGLAVWIIQAKSLAREDERDSAGFALAVGSAVALFTFILAPFVARFYEHEDLVWPLRFLSIGFVFDSLQIVPRGVLRRQMRFKELGIINLGVSLSRSALQLSLAALGFGYLALVAGILFRSVAEAAWLLIKHPAFPGLRWNPGLYRNILGFGIPATISMVCWVIFSTADNIVVGKLFGVELLGFYAMAFYLSDLPLSKFSTIVKPIALAHYSQVSSESVKLQSEFLKLTRNSLLLIFPILLGLAVVAPEGVPLMLGEHWNPMVIPFQVLCVAGLLRGFTDCISTVLIATNHPRRDLAVNTVGVGMLPVLFWYLGSRHGIEGVYMTWLSFYPVIVLFAVFMLRSAIGLSPLLLLSALMPVFAVAAFVVGGAYLGALLAPHPSGLEVLIAKIIGGLAGGAAAALLFRKLIAELLPAKRFTDRTPEALTEGLREPSEQAAVS